MSFFRRRDNSDKSRDGDDTRMVVENISDISDEIFSDGLNSPALAKMFFNCLRNIENQVKDLCLFQEETTKNNIKVTESLTSMSKKLDNLEKSLKEKDEEIENLENKIQLLDERNQDLLTENKDISDRLDDLEQYSRRNCLLLHGVREDDDENTDEIILSTIATEIGINITEQDIDRTHRLGRPNRRDGKPRPIIVKFSRYNVRNKVYQYKRNLKGKRYLITESLTSHRMRLFKEAQQEYGITNVWTSDGRILYKFQNKVSLYKS